MARTAPYAEANALGPPFLFGLALLAAAVAVVAALCGIRRSQKSSTPKRQSPPASTHHSRAAETFKAAATEAATVQQMEVACDPKSTESASTTLLQTLPPPPAAVAKQQHEEGAEAPLQVLPGFHGPLPGEGRAEGRAGPRRGMSMNLSVSMKKLPEGLTRIRTGRNKDQKEDSIWMKTIIMGEKCRVPDEDEEGGSVVVRDEKGNPQRSYRQMTPRSLPGSRANSFTDKESVTPRGK